MKSLTVKNQYLTTLKRNYRLVFAAISIFAACLAIGESASASLPQPVYGTVGGQSVRIGTLESWVRGNNCEEAWFQLNDDYKYLMCDAQSQQFRYFQISVNDSNPANWHGEELGAPYTDPPSGGWDYERDPPGDWQNGVPGGDTSPFYEDDPGFTTSTFGTYNDSIKNYMVDDELYTLIHSEERGYVITQDAPYPYDYDIVFDTFITYINPYFANNKQFIVLAGYSWGFDSTGGSIIQPSILDISSETLKTTVTNALGADGFSGWSARYGLEIPEPRTLALLGLGSLAMFRRRG